MSEASSSLLPFWPSRKRSQPDDPSDEHVPSSKRMKESKENVIGKITFSKMQKNGTLKIQAQFVTRTRGYFVNSNESMAVGFLKISAYQKLRELKNELIFRDSSTGRVIENDEKVGDVQKMALVICEGNSLIAKAYVQSIRQIWAWMADEPAKIRCNKISKIWKSVEWQGDLFGSALTLKYLKMKWKKKIENELNGVTDLSGIAPFEMTMKESRGKMKMVDRVVAKKILVNEKRFVILNRLKNNASGDKKKSERAINGKMKEILDSSDFETWTRIHVITWMRVIERGHFSDHDRFEKAVQDGLFKLIGTDLKELNRSFLRHNGVSRHDDQSIVLKHAQRLVGGQIDRDKVCPICTTNEKTHTFTSGCGHRFCEECIGQLTQMQCPECRLPFASSFRLF